MEGGLVGLDADLAKVPGEEFAEVVGKVTVLTRLNLREQAGIIVRLATLLHIIEKPQVTKYSVNGNCPLA